MKPQKVTDYLDRLILAGWGSVPQVDIPAAVMDAAVRGEEIPPGPECRKESATKPGKMT